MQYLRNKTPSIALQIRRLTAVCRGRTCRALRGGLIGLTLFFPQFALAQIQGEPTVIDGNTLRVEDEEIRLYGIDAPEAGQTCRQYGQPYPCGEIAAATLRTLVGNSVVVCEVVDAQAAGLSRGLCRNAYGQDLGEAMVVMGWALADPQQSDRYAEAEASAKASRSGLWGGDFVPPWDWRDGERLSRGQQ